MRQSMFALLVVLVAGGLLPTTVGADPQTTTRVITIFHLLGPNEIRGIKISSIDTVQTFAPVPPNGVGDITTPLLAGQCYADTVALGTPERWLARGVTTLLGDVVDHFVVRYTLTSAIGPRRNFLAAPSISVGLGTPSAVQRFSGAGAPVGQILLSGDLLGANIPVGAACTNQMDVHNVTHFTVAPHLTLASPGDIHPW